MLSVSLRYASQSNMVKVSRCIEESGDDRGLAGGTPIRSEMLTKSIIIFFLFHF